MYGLDIANHMRKQDEDTRSLPIEKAWEGKAIMLVDLDAFFASVEQLDNPSWRGKPVIVGGSPESGGVVATCSYEAREYGVRSAQAAAIAKRLCPDAIWTFGHFSRYKEMSDKIMQILRDETPFLQQVSIDEAFMDVTPTRSNPEHPAKIARRIQQRIEEMGVTCSIGLGTSKSIAKVASEADKPRGLTIVYPGSEHAFLDPLPIRAMSGIGAKSEKILNGYGIYTLKDLGCADLSVLKRVFGVNAKKMRDRACGLNDSEVESEHIAKSISNESTYPIPLKTSDEAKAAIKALADNVGRRLRRKGLKGSTVTLRIKYCDMEAHTAQCKIAPTDNERALYPALFDLFDGLHGNGKSIKLLGVGVSSFDGADLYQEALFEASGESSGSENAAVLAKHAKLVSTTDALKDRFGEDSVRFGHELRHAGNTTHTSSKNPADYR